MVTLQEPHKGVFAQVQIFENHPNEQHSYIIADVQQIQVSSITVILPQANTWIGHIYKCTEDGKSLVALAEEVHFVRKDVTLTGLHSIYFLLVLLKHTFLSAEDTPATPLTG